MVKVVAGIDTIFTTPEHPFYVESKGMTQAQFLHKGDLLSTVAPTEASLALLPHLARSGIAVESIQLLDSTVTVYNFEVSDFHTYFVGSQSIWGHNACFNWGNLIPTQPLYDAASKIYRSFELKLPNQKIWVHGNATENLRELEIK